MKGGIENTKDDGKTLWTHIVLFSVKNAYKIYGKVSVYAYISDLNEVMLLE